MAVPDLSELEALLDERGLSFQVHIGEDYWSVWLYAPDDPAALSIGEGETLTKALEAAIEEWDSASSDTPSVLPPAVGQA